jgi:predicted hotdog family 3-hydroxylacyl-ACP dehydratase
METLLADRSAVINLIPQAPPMVMIDGLVKTDEKITETTFKILAENVFVSDGRFSASGLTENIAQTAAVRGGYMAAAENKAVNIGFIGAVKKLKVYELPAVGETLDTRIEIKNRVLSFSLVTGQVFCKGKLVAECDMRIFEKIA